jgi:hypothetical protein
MRAWWGLVGVLSFGACAGKDTDTDPDGDADAHVDADWDFLSGVQDKDGCQHYVDSDGVDHTDVEGATTYWRGNLAVSSNGDVDGWEYWVQLPNQAWTDSSGAEDCALVFHVFGGVTDDLGGCGSCDIALELHAQLDDSLTDCIDDFVSFQKGDGYDSYDEGYSIKELGSSHALTWYFPSGNEFSSGVRDGGVYSYTTDGACAWY